MHRERYRAVEHIHLKQSLYLQGATPYGTPKGNLHPPVSIADDGVE